MSATPVAQADNTVAAIRRKVRKLTASASEASLSTPDLDNYINVFYNNDFPYAIKLDQMRFVYTFFTQPYIDKYPLDVNYNQGVRAPVYVDGIAGAFYKDRAQFFNMFPRWPTLSKPIQGDGVTTTFAFTSPNVPFLTGQVTMGGTDLNGNPIAVSDDGYGNLIYEVPNPQVSVPPARSVYPPNTTIGGINVSGMPVPGMYNLNTLNPGLNSGSIIGSVNYLTGQFNITFPAAPASGTSINLFVSQYQTGRPYTLLFWNNEFHVRPVPKLVHRIEVETYMTPVQFMESTDSPTLNQWWQYIAIGAACEILRDRQDMEGLANLMDGFKRQEGLVLERQGVEEIGQRNSTIFSGTVAGQGWNQGYGMGWY